MRFRENAVAILSQGQSGSGVALEGKSREAYENSDTARRVFEAGSKISKIDLVAICFGDQSDKLEKTEFAQPALSAAYLAEYIYLTELGFKPDAGEGHSMGEIPLLAMADVISVEGMFKLINARGAATARASRLRPGMMGRSQGMSNIQLEEELADLLKTGRLFIANFNTRLQHMLTGDEDLITEARDLIRGRAKKISELKNAKISRTRIPPFHSPYHMVPAKRRYKNATHNIEYSEPAFDIMLNNGLYLDELGLDNLADYLVGQLVGQVLFSQGTKRLIDDGVANFVEVGEKPVLSDLVLEDFADRVNVVQISKYQKTENQGQD